MLAVSGRPFDSQEHYFEFKWDGYRAGAMIEGGRLRLMSRGGLDLAERYPGLAPLGRLPAGLALDGEIVAFRDGRPDFSLLQRHGPRADQSVVRFVAFDLLYQDFQSRLELPFAERRERLEGIVAGSAAAGSVPQLILSEGLRGEGRALYRRACQQGLEGVVAKRLSSPYAPGRRNGAWTKIKRRLALQAVIIGWVEKPGSARPAGTPERSSAGMPDFQSLLVAGSGLPGEQHGVQPGMEAGVLRYLGKVGGGFSEELRARILDLLQARPRRTPLVPCPEKKNARWVEPGLYCEVSFAELTPAGLLRAPVFERLIEE
jgi:bifunctional non-homologous end joining protein LigD